jgi:hypothetical protein
LLPYLLRITKLETYSHRAVFRSLSCSTQDFHHAVCVWTWSEASDMLKA